MFAKLDLTSLHPLLRLTTCMLTCYYYYSDRPCMLYALHEGDTDSICYVGHTAASGNTIVATPISGSAPKLYERSQGKCILNTFALLHSACF